MVALLVSSTVALLVTLLFTPLAIRFLRRRSIGQFIQSEISGHAHKQGTPTMGGLVIVGAVTVGYVGSHVVLWTLADRFTLSAEPFLAGGLLAILAMLGMALVGFADDYIAVRYRRSLGLSKRIKYLGQLLVAILFAYGASAVEVSTELSFVRPLGWDLAAPLGGILEWNIGGVNLGLVFSVWVLLMLTGTANGANLADGMDGLAAGSAALMFGAYTVIAFWQHRHPDLYHATDPRELAIVSAAMMGALLGFLWWNAPPARIFMGDVGSNAIGGLLAALAVLSNTHLLLLIIAGLYVLETLSVIIQIVSFRMWERRVFRMAPIHFHFDLKGWPETTVVIRFWIVSALGVALGLGLFYGDFLQAEGLL